MRSGACDSRNEGLELRVYVCLCVRACVLWEKEFGRKGKGKVIKYFLKN